MRSSGDGLPDALARLLAGLTLALVLASCAAGGDHPQLAASPVSGPLADYPVVVGEPYAVAGITYTPQDVLNYDEVGYLAADAAGGDPISGAHHTLPLPSYVEITSLETGRTILVRLERRGPMTGHELAALSPGAMAQLGAASGHPVRVRRVNPPEEQRALLRAGEPAPPRMDTPMALVEVLRRKLPTAAAAPAVEIVATQPPLPERAAPPPAAGEGRFLVQAASFSSEERARAAALALGGEVSRAGPYFRVRTGPFATRGEAEASLAKVRAAGYTDARIFTSG